MTKIQKENPVLLQARKQGHSTIVLSLTNFIENRKFYLVQKQCDGSVLIKEADIKEKRKDMIDNE